MRFIKAPFAPVDARYVTLIGTQPQQAAEQSEQPDAPGFPRPRGVDVADVACSDERPQRCPELAYLTLPRLRAYRNSLLIEEVRVSYWRRILQARRDLLRAGSPVEDGAITAVLTEDRPRNGRRMILTLHPEGGMPILPKLHELWDGLIDDEDEQTNAELFVALGEAAIILSSYREALHRRLNRATADLVARYREDPELCLAALPAPY